MQKALRDQTNKKGIDYVIALRTEHGQPIENLSPLSAEDEQLYLSYYTKQLAGKGRKKWPPKVVATAVTFVKRFYLYHSCMEHEVDKVVFTCLYVAGKVCPSLCSLKPCTDEDAELSVINVMSSPGVYVVGQQGHSK